jgi:hypothetical protein
MLTDRAALGPLIQVRSVADTEAQARSTDDAVLAAINSKLADLQSQAGVPASEQITANVVTSSRVASAQSGSMHHAQAAALAIGYLLGGVIWRRLVRFRRLLIRKRLSRERRSLPTQPTPSLA